eukprot:2273121-Prymnesium_polylepis.1
MLLNIVDRGTHSECPGHRERVGAVSVGPCGRVDDPAGHTQQRAGAGGACAGGRRLRVMRACACVRRAPLPLGEKPLGLEPPGHAVNAAPRAQLALRDVGVEIYTQP